MGSMKKPLIPLAMLTPPKPIGQMTDAERRAFAGKMFDAIAANYKPVPAIPQDAVRFYTDAAFGGLYRVDHKNWVAAGLSSAGWNDAPNVMRKFITGDNLSYVEVSSDRAVELAAKVGHDAAVLTLSGLPAAQKQGRCRTDAPSLPEEPLTPLGDIARQRARSRLRRAGIRASIGTPAGRIDRPSHRQGTKSLSDASKSNDH
jgi:hypothetical protein